MDTKSQAYNSTSSFEDFEPSFDWVREEALDTLVLYLPAFKKEQLRVQVSIQGKLIISGERPIEGKRWSRFIINFHVPTNCNINDINSKFIGGLLYVNFPKKPIQITTQEQPPLHQEASLVGEKTTTDESPLEKDQMVAGNIDDRGKKTNGTTENAENCGVCSSSMHKKPVGNGLLVELSRNKKFIVGVVVVVGMVIGMVAARVYVTRELRKSPGEDFN